MSISIDCKKCGKSVKAPDSAAGKTGKCPACSERVVIPMPDAATFMALPAKPRTRKAADPPKRESRLRKIRLAFPAEEVERDLHFKIAAWIAGGALLLLALSPLFKWIAFGAGGVAGIKGDGRFVLALSIASLAAGAVAVFTGKRFSLLILASQAWATIAVFWMGALIWKVGAILDAPEIQGNPFAAIFATQIGPGAGLYMGLIGGLAAAGALGFIIVRHMRAKGELQHYYIAQGIAVVVGIGIAVLVGPQMKGARGADRPSPFASASTSRNRDSGGAPSIFTPDEPELPRVSGVELVPSLQSKRFQKSDFQEFIVLDIDWRVAKADRPIRAVKGRLLLQDLFGETQFGIGWSINRSLRRGDTFSEEGTGFKYNQFMDSHHWVRSTDKNDLRVAFVPESVLYADGTRETF